MNLLLDTYTLNPVMACHHICLHHLSIESELDNMTEEELDALLNAVS